MNHRFLRPAARALAAAFLVPVLAAPALAQDAARIERLERAVRDLQGVVYSVEGNRPAQPRAPIGQTGQGGAGPDAGTVVRMAELEEEVARLTGRIEELTFRLAEQQRQLDTVMQVLSGPVDGASAEAGAEGGAAPSGDGMSLAEQAARLSGPDGPRDLSAGEPASAPAQQRVELPADADDAYELAYEALLAGDYDRAEAAFEAFVEVFPDAVQTPEAKYLLGEIYLATGAYAEAATLFLDHVRTYPDDARAPEAYLKLGTAFARLDRTEEACKVFAAGTAKFPDMAASVKARYAAEQGKAGCRA